MITDFIGKQSGDRDEIAFTLTACSENELIIRVDEVSNRWKHYTGFESGKEYTLKRHHNSDLPPFGKFDPMELWEWIRPGQKEDETILPQVLMYYWHKDDRLSLVLGW